MLTEDEFEPAFRDTEWWSTPWYSAPWVPPIERGVQSACDGVPPIMFDPYSELRIADGGPGRADSKRYFGAASAADLYAKGDVVERLHVLRLMDAHSPLEQKLEGRPFAARSWRMLDPVRTPAWNISRLLGMAFLQALFGVLLVMCVALLAVLGWNSGGFVIPGCIAVYVGMGMVVYQAVNSQATRRWIVDWIIRRAYKIETVRLREEYLNALAFAEALE